MMSQLLCTTVGETVIGQFLTACRRFLLYPHLESERRNGGLGRRRNPPLSAVPTASRLTYPSGGRERPFLAVSRHFSECRSDVPTRLGGMVQNCSAVGCAEQYRSPQCIRR